jgi:hypothetical protein
MAMSGWRASQWRAPRLFDPYYDWAVATKFRYYGKADWFPVLLEVQKQKSNVLAFASAYRNTRGTGWGESVRVPPLYMMQVHRLHKPTYFLTAFVKQDFIQKLYAGDVPSEHFASFQLGRAVEFTDKQAGFGAAGPNTGVPRNSVVIGVIDDDIAFGHERFQDAPGSTRIHYFWDQVEPLAGGSFYGKEAFKNDRGTIPGIDRRLGIYANEDQFYRSYGYLDYWNAGHKAYARRGGHGTHVLDLACNPPQPGIGPLVAVQLPSATTQDTSGGSLAPQVYDALMYMLMRADDISSANKVPALPLVVNLSYGMPAGPHDGTGQLERAIDEVIDSVNTPQKILLQVVLPAGNAHLSRGHAQFSLQPKTSEVLRWRVLPDDWTESFLEIWYPGVDDSGKCDSVIQVSVRTPTGNATVAFGEGTTYEWQPTAGVTAAMVSFYPAVAPGTRKLIRISLAPTAWPDGALTLAPAGVWEITVQNAGGAPVSDIHSWVQRDDTAIGYARRGRQSYFDHGDYARFDTGGRPIEQDPIPSSSVVRRDATINAIATRQLAIVVGGFRRSDWKQAPYTASGPVVDAARKNPYPDGPDAMAVSDDSPSHRGVLAAGSRNGTAVAMQGTSVAAPQIARLAAIDLLRPTGRGDRYAVKAAALASEAAPPAGAKPKAPVERSGAGRLDIPSRRPRRFDP